MIKLLIGYNRKHNIINISGILHRYAPTSENHTLRYIDFVVERTGIPAGKTIKFDKPTLSKIVKAMARFENGQIAVTNDDFNEAWDLV